MSFGDRFQPVVALDDFNLRRELVLQFRLLRVVEILVLQDLVDTNLRLQHLIGLKF